MGEADNAVGADDVNGGVWQEVVGLAGGGFEVDLVFAFVFGDKFGGHLERDAEAFGGFHGAVGEQPVVEFFAVGSFRKFGGLVRADGEDLMTGSEDIGFDSDQVGEMARAIRTPAATVEDEHGRFFFHKVAQFDFGTGFVPQGGIWDCVADRSGCG